MARTNGAKGMTLIELMVVVSITGVLVGMVVSAMVEFDRTKRARDLVSQLQGSGRAGLQVLEDDLRTAALGVRKGAIWSVRNNNRVSRPAVQIFENIPDDADPLGLEAKPGTDAILVVRSSRGEWAKATREHVQGETALDVAQNPAAGRQIRAGQAVLVGDLDQAGWDVVRAVNNDGATLQLSSITDVFPGIESRSLAQTASVRPAEARLYYVTRGDELVRLDLRVPRPPEAAADAVTRVIVAQGVENMQVGCEVENAGALADCPGPLAIGQEEEVEARAAFGAFAAGSGPRLQAAGASLLRMVNVSLVVRSLSPVADGAGDPPITLSGVTLGTQPPAGPGYMRRSYRLALAVRNTSLEAL